MKNLLITPAVILAGLSLPFIALADDYAAEGKEAAKAEKKAPAKKMAMKKGMEKCYGIAKAGKNDCAAADGKVTCAGSQKVDGDEDGFIVLPKGVCERIVGGTAK